MKINIFLLFVTYLLLVTSCKTKEIPNEFNYLQNAEDIATEASVKTSAPTIQKGDQLSIFVSAKNMEVVKAFNQNYYTSQIPASSNNANSPKIYLVDSEGNIDFPILGTLNTANRSLEGFRNEINEKVSYYVKSPTVTVNIVNFKVTVLGEVARPGQYTVPEGKGTLLTAIGMAGDLTMYGKRDNILLLRNENGVMTKERLDLMNTKFINSPYFDLKQGDVIYVSANSTREKFSRLDPNTGTYIAIAGTIVGLAGIFITIFKK
ncbi:polysaccharide biosynthesis/export family protein [Kaistella sp.]|uniref:polysaccharide biosynthesis/export family protein n=1 Tax=Kaistella sp. TaxID=2782235 RepID=UPI0035A1C55C